MRTLQALLGREIGKLLELKAARGLVPKIIATAKSIHRIDQRIAHKSNELLNRRNINNVSRKSITLHRLIKNYQNSHFSSAIYCIKRKSATTNKAKLRLAERSCVSLSQRNKIVLSLQNLEQTTSQIIFYSKIAKSWQIITKVSPLNSAKDHNGFSDINFLTETNNSSKKGRKSKKEGKEQKDGKRKLNDDSIDGSIPESKINKQSDSPESSSGNLSPGDKTTTKGNKKSSSGLKIVIGPHGSNVNEASASDTLTPCTKLCQNISEMKVAEGYTNNDELSSPNVANALSFENNQTELDGLRGFENDDSDPLSSTTVESKEEDDGNATYLSEPDVSMVEAASVEREKKSGDSNESKNPGKVMYTAEEIKQRAALIVSRYKSRAVNGTVSNSQQQRNYQMIHEEQNAIRAREHRRLEIESKREAIRAEIARFREKFPAEYLNETYMQDKPV